ncbi:hypothetical protein ROJ8625_01136 [Roseivivax jejudonensis]|uniref:HTH cro/C1-type domain-containing protein n=1 Tax=Roseivivax jejudonensis TaxID=1529041 RepID=A0A1X6YPI6_9RHOB|nr:helix-turn-helix transcriptional regulator [Roseivivax jejudonensis]SLN27515.1 hypothetical protein ROJ8625_01136 [Roseivivax jejudonensis]
METLPDPTPAELRHRLGENLRVLSRSAPSISALCRELGINRTQFNRYRAGESFPRPDVLWRICRHFRVDARILLEPVADVISSSAVPFCHSELSGFFSAAAPGLSEADMPSGFYRSTHRDAALEDRYRSGLVLIYRRDGHVFVRGFTPRTDAVRASRDREFRGLVLHESGGAFAITSRRDGNDVTYMRLRRFTDDPDLWFGEALGPPHSDPSRLQIVYEFLGSARHEIFATARTGGIVMSDALPDRLRGRL